MRAVLIALAVVMAACAAPVSAATVAQAQCASTTFVSAPPNGDTVVGGTLSTGTSPTLTDSNSLTYPLREQTLAGTFYVNAFGGVVSGTPGATYTFTGASGQYCLYDVQGVSGAAPATGGQGTTGTTFTASLGSVTVGSFVACYAFNTNGDFNTSSATVTNGAVVYEINNTGYLYFYAIATATASYTASVTASVSSTAAISCVAFGPLTPTAGYTPYRPEE